MKLTVGVFFGGVSCEHEISIISANQTMNAIDKTKYDVLPVYISKNSDFYIGEKLFDLHNYVDLNALCGSLEKVCLCKDGNKVYLKPVKSGLFGNKAKTIDVAFLVMHGTNGEDGALQGMMEMLNLPYTSSGVLGGAIGQDKAVMKQILSYEEIPVCPWFSMLAHDFNNNQEEYLDKAEKLGYPLIIKPANLGSSIGIEVAHNREEFVEKVKECSKYDFKLVVEQLIKDLTEVNISVMGNRYECKTSAIEQVMHQGDLLDYQEKYLGGGKSAKGVKQPMKNGGKLGSKGMASLSRLVPAPIGSEKTAEIEELAKKTFKALNANGVVRIDFMIDNTSDKVYVNEINTIPGSLAFYLWNETGMDFAQECDYLIENALKMYREKEKKTYSFSTNVLSKFKG